MSDDYAGIDFTVGSVRGIRRWTVDVNGRLHGVTHSDVWYPGENIAKCHCYPGDKRVKSKGEGEAWADYQKRVDAWKASHDLEEGDHGFYAYFGGKGEGGHYSNTPHVIGVIEGYGEVLIGTKGFRAMKARILALAVEPFEGMWKLDQFFLDRLRANYPVPVFESALAMSMEFPAEEPVFEEAAA